MALKILLVDPSTEWLDEATKYFKENYYEVDCASNGKDAQLKLYNNKYFAVVLNYDVKNHPGSQVLKYISTSTTGLTVVLTMNEDRIESGEKSVEDFMKFGVQEVVTPPFELDTLKSALEGHQSVGQILGNIPKRDGVSDEVEMEASDNAFTKIRIEEFFSSQTVLFDVFIRLASGKYLKILHAGDSFSKDRLDKYKNEKGVEFLYFQSKDRKKYVRFYNYLSRKMNKNEQVNSNAKLALMKNVTEKFIEDAYCDGVKPQIVEQGKEICKTVYDMIQKENSLYKILRDYQDFDPSAYSHSFLVSFFASMIVKQFEWESAVTTETVAMACMFHDIGKTKLPEEIATMKASDMSPEQFEIYKQHPVYSAEILQTSRLITPSVKQIVIQHHECSDGSGFPYGIRDSKMLTLSKIVFLANEFAHVVVDNQLTPVEALKKMLSNPDATKRYNALILERFLKVFIDPSKISAA